MGIVDRTARLYSLGMKLRQVGRIQIGRILGSVPTTSGSYKALIDLLERCYFMRAELNAVAALLIKTGVYHRVGLAGAVGQGDGRLLRGDRQGVARGRFTDDGYTIKDVKALAERAKREGWPP